MWLHYGVFGFASGILRLAESPLNTGLPGNRWGHSRAIFSFSEVLTIVRGCPYISVLRRADAHRRDGAPLKLHTTSRWERHPTLSEACFDGSPVSGEGTFIGPG